MLAHLDTQGVPYTRTAGGGFTGTGGEDPQQGVREDTGERYTYIGDPDDNLIELVYHPRGLEGSSGEAIDLTRDAGNVRWTQIEGFVEAAYAEEQVSVS